MKRLVSSTARFLRERLAGPLLPRSVVSQVNRNDRAGALFKAWGHVFSNQLRGAYYEFGVYRGDSFRAAFGAWKAFDEWQRGQLLAEERWRRRVADGYAGVPHPFYAFDTFSGMPDNDEGNPAFAAGNFGCSLGEFQRLNRGAGMPGEPRVRCFRGTFSDTASRERAAVAELEQAAIANIDCDLYASARDALALVGPKLRQGSVLLMDDWSHFGARRDAGSRKALAEFLEATPGLSVESWFSYEFVGRAFLVHRNDEDRRG